MMLPNPAVLESFIPDNDEVTGTNDTTPMRVFIHDPEITSSEDGAPMLAYVTLDGDIRGAQAVTVDDGRYISSADGSVRIRAVDPYDAVYLAPVPGIAQPISAVRAAVLSGGSLAQELDAVVAADNTIATLMLETSVGTFVRYSGDWQLLRGDSDSLEDLSLVAVGAKAVDIFDAADSAGQTIRISDLPIPSSADDGTDFMQQPGEVSKSDLDTGVDVDGIQASGAFIPMVASVEDLDLAIRYAHTHPETRWYVAKRAQALEASARIPAEWTVGGVVRPFVPRVAV